MAEAMALLTLKELVALQNSRLAEIRHFKEELNQKPLESLSKHFIGLRINAIQNIWSEVLQTNSKIMARENVATEPYVVEGTFGRIGTAYSNLLKELLSVNVRFNIINSKSNFDRPAFPSFDDLPKFSGDSKDFESFAALFVRLIHPQITSDATRLVCLQQCLTGNAAKSINDFPPSDENYKEAWKKLKRRFYNPRFVVGNYLSDLMNITTLERESSVDLNELNKFRNEAQRIVCGLTNLGMPVKKWDMWFVHILSSKLDEKTRRAWIEEQVEREMLALQNVDDKTLPWVLPDAMHTFPTFSQFMDFLQKRSEILLRIEKMTRDHECVLNLRANPVKCYFCSEPHDAGNCKVFLSKTVKERELEIQRLKLCYSCLGKHKHHKLLDVDGNITT